MFWNDEIPVAGRDRFLGNELDSKFSYAYTEDLQFSLIGAWFLPGEYFKTEALSTNVTGQSAVVTDDSAKEIVAEIALTF